MDDSSLFFQHFPLVCVETEFIVHLQKVIPPGFSIVSFIKFPKRNKDISLVVFKLVRTFRETRVPRVVLQNIFVIFNLPVFVEVVTPRVLS